MAPHPSEKELADLLGGLLPDGRRERVAAHTDGCAACRAVLERLTAVPPDLWASLAVAGGPVAAHSAAKVPPVAGYADLHELGRGGCGIVYRAREVATGREVALKVLRSGPLATAAEQGWFRTEVRAAARLRHPNVVTVHAVGEAHELPYYVMEYLPGGSLAGHLDGTPFDPRRAAGLVEVVARAVDYAHAQGVVHRDLKPGNILLDAPVGEEFGVPKVSDFGLAKFPEAGTPPTPTQAVLGTPNYMAPEQAFGRSKAVGPAADVYSLGAILYELLTGRPPFRGQTPYETLVLVRNQEPVPPSRFRAGVPRDLETVCLKCLEKSLGRRYPTAAALADDLGRFLAGRPVAARPIGPLVRLSRWARRTPVVAGLSAALVVLTVVAVVGSTLLWRRAEASAAVAREKAEEAERRQSRTREALRLYTAAANILFRDPSAMKGPERAALVRALELYEEVLAEAAGDPEEEHRAAFATLQLADGMLNAGELGPAERGCRRAVAVLRRLDEAHPDRPDFRYDHSQGCVQLASTLVAAGKFDEAVVFRREAIRLAEDLAGRYPQSDKYGGSLAAYRVTAAIDLLRGGDVDGADKLLVEAIPVTRTLLDKYPEAMTRYADYELAASTRADLLLFERDDPEGYVRLLRELMDRAEQARAKRPNDWWRFAHAVSWYHIRAATVLDRLGRGAEAEAVLRTGLELLRDVSEGLPSNQAYRRAYARVLWECGHRVWSSDRARASDLFRRAAQAFEVIVSESPADPGYERELAVFLACCPDPAVRDPARALGMVGRLSAAGRPVDRWVHGACLYEAGKYQAAASELTAYLREKPNPAHRAHGYLALARWHAGDEETAREGFRTWSAHLRTLWHPRWSDWEVHDRAWAVIEGTNPPPRRRP